MGRIVVIGIIIILFIKNRRDSEGYNIRGRDRAGRDRQGYDKEGYDKWGTDRDGYNRKGYDRRGFDRNGLYHGYSVYDSSGYDKDGYNSKGFNSGGIHKKTRTHYDENGYDKWGFDRDGFNSKGFNFSGYDKNGYNKDGYDKDGFDKNGYDKDGFDERGFNKKGIHRDTGTKYDKSSLDKDGFDKDGWSTSFSYLYRKGKIYGTKRKNGYGINKYTLTEYDKDGFDINGYDENGYDKDGYDENGYDKDGFDIYGFNEDGKNKYTGTEYDKNGFHFDGFNKKGIHRDTGTKYDENGYDRNGYDENGLDFDGESKESRKRASCFEIDINKFDEDLQKILNTGDIKGFIFEDDLYEILDNPGIVVKVQKICKKYGIKIIPGEKKLNSTTKKKSNTKQLVGKGNTGKSIKICSIASGSNGNCYYIGTNEESILIDDGISYKQLSSRMKEANLNIDSVRGVFISHEHSDHVKGLPIFHKNHPNVPIYFNEHAFRGVKSSDARIYESGVKDLEEGEISIGGFKVYAFMKKHDARYPLSFRIECNGISIGVFTDIGEHSTKFRNHFSKCHAVFLEANHDVTMLRNGSYPSDLKDRVYDNHFSNDNAYDMLKNHANSNLQVVIFSHLSKENNSISKVKQKFQEFNGKYKLDIASREDVGKVYKIE